MNVRILAFSLASLLSLAACSTGGSAGSVKGDVYYLEPMASRLIDRRYIDRYACPAHVLLKCHCDSRLSQSCLCNC